MPTSERALAEQAGPERTSTYTQGASGNAGQFDISLGYAPLPLRAGHANLIGLNNIRSLCDHLLDRDRDRPVVILSTFPGTRRRAVDAAQLATELGDVADVAAIADQGVTWTLAETCGQAFTCHSGAVRVVPVPGAALAMTSIGLFQAAHLVRFGSDEAFDMLVNAAVAASVVPRLPGSSGRKRNASPASGPRDMEAAVAQAQQTCKGLAFLPSAFSSTRESPYRWPQRALSVLEGLNAAALDMAGIGLRGSTALREALRERGLFNAYRAHISDTTAGMYAEDYTFPWKGEPHLFAQHLTVGVRHGPDKCMSVHFDADPDSSLLVVAHVGTHGRNTRS